MSDENGDRVAASRGRMFGAIAVVAVVFLALAAFAFNGWGLFAAVLFAVGIVFGASGPPVSILLLRDGMPFRGLIGTGLVIAAQVAFGGGALIRRDDGGYEWTVLREDGEGLFAVLKNGREVPIDGDRGELFSFGFATLAITEEKTERNMDRWTETPVPGESDQPIEQRAGIPVTPPRQEHGGWVVSLANIQRAIRGSASSTLIRRGRDKALDEEGGTGALSELWTMGFATMLMVMGFVLTAGALML